MKKISLFIFSIAALFSCVEDDASGIIVEEGVVVEAPVAVNDEIFVVKNTTFKIEDLLENDTIYTYGRISSVTLEEESGATIEAQGDNVYKYTPEADFVGETSFTYEVCDENLPANCSTGTVSVIVTEEFIEFAANDDIVVVNVNTALVIENLLSNDFQTENAVIDSIDVSATNGTVELEGNNITYTPQVDFTGADSLTYTICSDFEDGTNKCSTATVFITVVTPIEFNITSELVSYYNSVEFLDDPTVLLDALRLLTIESHTSILEYGDRHDYLYDADADLDNADNVVLIYNSEVRADNQWVSGNNPNNIQTYNTEHIYPQSFLTDDFREADLHLLRVADASVNSDRSNTPFADGIEFGDTDGGWYPGDDWKGDVARVVMYVNMYYDEPFTDVGTLELFLEWNIEDPVSDFELQRNNVIEGAQGNRNPFIDNPYLATLIWGGDDAENTWE